MKYWLMKSEPNVFAWNDLIAQPVKKTFWEGVRNYQARNFMMKDMSVGDLAFFYHSSCESPGIFGVMEVIAPASADASSWNPKSKYYDPKSSSHNPRWFAVTLKAKYALTNPVFLTQLKSIPELSSMLILRKGNRLSITPVEKKHWDMITKLEN